LKTSGTVQDGTAIKYIAKRSDCSIRPLKLNCTSGRERRISRDDTRAAMEIEAYGDSYGQRKKIERLFGEAKQILSMIRFRLRGLTGARDELLLTATVQNLIRLANHTTKPPPQPMMACSLPQGQIQPGQQRKTASAT
jgi:hypothetical protein